MPDDAFDFGAAMSGQTPEIQERTREPEVELSLSLPTTQAMDFDISPVALSLVPYERQVALMVNEARGIAVSDQESNKVATATASRNKRLRVLLEGERKRFVGPLNDHIKQINNLFKTLTDPLSQNEALIKQQIDQFAYQLEMERRRREAELREEQRKLQAKLDEEARLQREEAQRKAQEAAEKLKAEEDEATRAALEKEIEEETAAAQAQTPTVTPIVVEKPGVTRTAEGASYQKFKWVCRIVAPALVPREYCEPDKKLLDAAVKAGIRSIPGTIIEEIAETHIRT